MKLTSHRSTRGAGRIARRLGAPVAVALLFVLSACGFGAQTLQDYQPSDGVNLEVGLGPNGDPTEETIKVRGLMVLAKPDGSAFLSASLTCLGSDRLTSITGFALKPDGSQGSELTIKQSGPIPVSDGELVQLIDQSPITVEGDLTVGLNAQLTLTFAEAGSEQVRVPIIDGSRSAYETVSPSPAPSSSSPDQP